MKVELELLTHPKYRRLKKLVGPLALEYLLRLWGRCGTNKRGEYWSNSGAREVEIVCEWDREPGKLFQAFVDCRFIDLAADAIIVHDWNDTNSYAVKNWNKNPSGKAKATPLASQQGAPASGPGSPQPPHRAPRMNEGVNEMNEGVTQPPPVASLPSEREFIDAFLADGFEEAWLVRKFNWFHEQRRWLNARGEIVDWKRIVRRWAVVDRGETAEKKPAAAGPVDLSEYREALK